MNDNIQIEKLIALNIKRLNLAKASFELAVFQENLDDALKWYNRYSKTLKESNALIALYNLNQ
ncbi:MAG: hypothetical protein PHG08_00915 [Bacilli bacterium]|nr:hypothetical protein [Bacilli bacterium]